MKFKSINEMAAGLRGLSPSEVRRSKEVYGDNNLVRTKRHSFFREFLRNFGDPIIKILLIALAVNIVIKLRDFDWYESIGIAAAILISTLVSTISEYGSEEAFSKLQEDALRTNCRVKRTGGITEIPVADVAVGDYVILQVGDRVPADGIIYMGDIYVDQSPLNGENKEAHKTPEEASDGGNGDFADKQRLFRGCIVTSGEAVMLVKAVGSGTFYGKLADELQEDSRESPLKARLGGLAASISRLGYAGAVLVALANLFYSIVIANGFNGAAIMHSLSTPGVMAINLINALTLAISVIVVAIPEGLPLMITVVLSSNMKRMLKDNVLVRKLVGIETSGNLNILFTDKTGTLTKGRLAVASLLTGSGARYTRFSELKKTGLGYRVRIACVLNSGASLDGKKAIGGNATERALLEFLDGDGAVGGSVRVTGAIPFDSRNKYSAAKVEGDYCAVLYKGAPELVLARCTHYYDENGVRRELTSRAKLKSEMAALTGEAFRLLALAEGSGELTEGGIPAGLTLIGITAIRDDVRREAGKAVQQVKRAGVQVVMITGDNRETAAAIAREVGLLSGGKNTGSVLTSDELRRMTDDEVKRALGDICVVSRAVPSDKSRLVRIAQDMGLTVGMTGDGINDAPALKKADVGFAMGSGTEVAKEASDIVILDDNFMSISKAILYGRTIFKSIRKFIIFQLTINLCAVGISVIGPFIGITSPITVLQMLWVNMVMDTLAGLAFAGEPPLPEYMNEPPKRRDEPIINSYMLNQIVVIGCYVTALSIAFLKLPFFRSIYYADSGPSYFMTAYFAMFIFAGVFNSFNARTTRLNLLANIWRNKAFVAIMSFVVLVQIAIIYYGGSVFRTTWLTAHELQVAIALAFTVIPVDFVRKRLISRRKRGNAI